jgi:hypothetical protein
MFVKFSIDVREILANVCLMSSGLSTDVRSMSI